MRGQESLPSTMERQPVLAYFWRSLPPGLTRHRSDKRGTTASDLTYDGVEEPCTRSMALRHMLSAQGGQQRHNRKSSSAGDRENRRSPRARILSASPHLATILST